MRSSTASSSARCLAGQNYAKDNRGLCIRRHISMQLGAVGPRQLASDSPHRRCWSGHIGGGNCTDGPSYGNAYSAALTQERVRVQRLAAYESMSRPTGRGTTKTTQIIRSVRHSTVIDSSDSFQFAGWFRSSRRASQRVGPKIERRRLSLQTRLGDLQKMPIMMWIRREVSCALKKQLNERSRDDGCLPRARRVNRPVGNQRVLCPRFKTPGKPHAWASTMPAFSTGACTTLDSSPRTG